MPETKDLTLISHWIDGPFRTSHHPLCEPFHGHTLRVFKRDVCRGCLFWYPGIALGLLSILVINVFAIGPENLAPLMFILVLPTLLQLILSIPRPIKDVARLLLGISTGLSLLIVLGYPDLLIRLIVLIVFIIIFVPLTIVRNNRNEAVCASCPQLALRSESKCSGFKFRREREAIANTQLTIGITDINEISNDVKSFDDI